MTSTQAGTPVQSRDSAMKTAQSISGPAGGTAGSVACSFDNSVCKSALPVKCRVQDRAHFWSHHEAHPCYPVKGGD